VGRSAPSLRNRPFLVHLAIPLSAADVVDIVTALGPDGPRVTRARFSPAPAPDSIRPRHVLRRHSRQPGFPPPPLPIGRPIFLQFRFRRPIQYRARGAPSRLPPVLAYFSLRPRHPPFRTGSTTTTTPPPPPANRTEVPPYRDKPRVPLRTPSKTSPRPRVHPQRPHCRQPSPPRTPGCPFVPQVRYGAHCMLSFHAHERRTTAV
jgi:hypothetical protein